MAVGLFETGRNRKISRVVLKGYKKRETFLPSVRILDYVEAGSPRFAQRLVLTSLG